jgi:hypothetical protein
MDHLPEASKLQVISAHEEFEDVAIVRVTVNCV